MTPTSPRLHARLRTAAKKYDDPDLPMAETWRRVCGLAEQLALPRPGYDTIRVILRAERQRRAELRRLLEPVAADVLAGRLSVWDAERLLEASALARESDE